MRLSILTLLLGLLFTFSACGQTEGRYVSVRTVTDVYFQDTILNIVTSDTTFRDTIFGTGGGVTGPATQTLDTIDFDFLVTAANLPGGTILNPDFTTEIPIPWNTSPVQTSARYTLSGSDVSVAVTGWYRVSGYLSTQQSNSQRYNGKVYLKKGGTLSDEWTATGYSRATSSQDQTTLYFEFYTQLTAGVPFQIVQICEGGNTGAVNAVNLDNAASRLYVIPLTQNFVELASGPAGQAGANGLSAYDIWLAQGNAGTEADFLASLQGETGPAGPAGGPAGPPGPAGSPSDTAADGSFYRLFTTDDAGAFYDQGSIDGTAGLELFNSGQGDLYRMYLTDDGMVFDGPAFFFLNELSSVGGFQSQPTSTSIFRDDMDLRFNASGAKFLDYRSTKKGIEYADNYSDDLKTNPRSIPDVGTVQEMIDEGGGGSVTNGEIVNLTGSPTVVVKASSYYHLTVPNNTTRMLTLDPSQLAPGAIIYVSLGSNFSTSAIATMQTTQGTFYFFGSDSSGQQSASIMPPFPVNFPSYTLLWSGNNFILLD